MIFCVCVWGGQRQKHIKSHRAKKVRIQTLVSGGVEGFKKKWGNRKEKKKLEKWCEGYIT